MREASERRTATDPDSYAFSFYNQYDADEGETEAADNVMNISLSQCREIIDIFNKRGNGEYDFDSHEFIKALELHFPNEYNSSLQKYESNMSREEAHQILHAQIGRFLSLNRNQLNIEKLGKHNSPNYKNDSSENETWKIH